MIFFQDYPLSEVKPADYNPRRLSEERFEALCESVKRFGMCVPIIVNSNGVIIAGHQRTRACKAVGITSVPVFMSKDKIPLINEVQFNLVHNTIDGACSVTVKPGTGFYKAKSNEIHCASRNVCQTKEICKLLSTFGEFGGCVCDSKTGDVIYGENYAASCEQMGIDCLVYGISHSIAEEFKRVINGDFGVYDYSKLDIPVCNQEFVQPKRFSERHGVSCLYNKLVLPKLSKSKSYIDFGAGKCAMALKLKNNGFNFHCYEPFYNNNSGGLNISAVVRMIRDIELQVKGFGLFDSCVLDSVLNSVTDITYERNLMLTVNALLKADGELFCNTRDIGLVNGTRKVNRDNSDVRGLAYLDEDNFSISVLANGIITKQHFHDKSGLVALLKKYFYNVQFKGCESRYIFAQCSHPKRFSLEEYEEALNAEFNMPYPNNYHHNQHTELVRAILERVKTR